MINLEKVLSLCGDEYGKPFCCKLGQFDSRKYREKQEILMYAFFQS
jgi:hypothetical protein